MGDYKRNSVSPSAHQMDTELELRPRELVLWLDWLVHQALQDLLSHCLLLNYPSLATWTRICKQTTKSVGATTQIINEGKNCVLKYKPVYHPALFAANGLHLWSHLHPSLKGHSRPNMNLPQFIEPCMLISAVLTVFSYVL